MSELKARMLGETMNEYGCDTKIYLKSEADKVIAEKDAEIRKLNFEMWSARCEAAKAECDEPRLARCRYMADKFKEASK